MKRLNGAAFAAIRGARRPVIAMIQGFCIGGGLAIALACDLRVADASALFALPPARLGLAYPLDGLRDLVATVGAPTAKEMIFTARRLKAEEALRDRSDQPARRGYRGRDAKALRRDRRRCALVDPSRQARHRPDCRTARA